jgi:selenium metabolism protein YedF
VIKTREALEAGGGELVVIVDNEGSCTNVRRFAESRGCAVEVEEQAGGFRLRIREGGGGACAVCASRDMVVFVSSEGMGRGDEELGRVLMAAFLDTLAQFAGEISHLIFVNAGVKLLVEGSPVLEQIKALAENGAEVLACGTCLDHFDLKEKLAVGSVSNMLVIMETLSKAGRCLSP